MKPGKNRSGMRVLGLLSGLKALVLCVGCGGPGTPIEGKFERVLPTEAGVEAIVRTIPAVPQDCLMEERGDK